RGLHPPRCGARGRARHGPRHPPFRHARPHIRVGPGLKVCDNVQPNWHEYCAAPQCGQLDLTCPRTLDVVKTLLTEVSRLFPDPVVHLGADEINRRCYEDFLDSGHSDVDALIGRFMTSVVGHVQALNKTVQLWEETALDFRIAYPKSTVFQAWRGPSSTAALVQAGFHVVVSDSGAWYLDCGLGSWVDGGQSWCEFKTWQTMYEFDPANNLDERQGALVDGGEAAVWTEKVDMHNLEQIVWPRLAAVAEVLWSPNDLGPTWCGLHGGCSPSRK
ncbi:beta-N-acetylhexosaminidase, partial [Synchytrium endobioticum]